MNRRTSKYEGGRVDGQSMYHGTDQGRRKRLEGGALAHTYTHTYSHTHTHTLFSQNNV